MVVAEGGNFLNIAGPTSAAQAIMEAQHFSRNSTIYRLVPTTITQAARQAARERKARERKARDKRKGKK